MVEKLMKKNVLYCVGCNVLEDLETGQVLEKEPNGKIRVFDMTGREIDWTQFVNDDYPWIGDLYRDGDQLVFKANHKIYYYEELEGEFEDD